MKKFLMLALAAVITLPAAANAQKSDAYWVDKSGKKNVVKSIDYNEKKKTYVVQEKNSPAKKAVDEEKVLYAWIPMPDAVKNAEEDMKNGKAAEAAKALEAAAEEYKRFGWQMYCLNKCAEALEAANDLSAAIAMREKIGDTEIILPEDELTKINSNSALSNIFVKQKNYDKALEMINMLTAAKNETAACAAYIERGNIYHQRANDPAAKDRKSDMEQAALAYFTAALLFQSAERCPEALYKSWAIMKEMKDARAERFAAILREKFPNSDYTKRLK